MSPPTASPPKPRSAKRKPKPKKPAASPASTAEPAIAAKLLPLRSIEASPFNPRQVFDKDALDQLAASMKRQSQLQPCLVRPKPGTSADARKYQLVAGERRWRAAKRAKLPGLLCVVRDLTDAEAVEAAGSENYDRRDFNPLEEARWFRAMIEQGKMTQRELATRVRLSQSKIAQRLGLLELPAGIQQQVSTGVINASWTRPLLPWRERADVMADVARRLKKYPPRSEHSVQDAVFGVITERGRPVKSGYWGEAFRMVTVHFTLTANRREELDVVKVTRSNGWTLEVAMNVERWEQLQAEGNAKAKANASTSEPASHGGTPGGGSGGLSPADKAKRAKKVLTNKLYAWRVGWHQTRALELLDELAKKPVGSLVAPDWADVVRLLTFLASRRDAADDGLSAALEAGGGEVVGRQYVADPWPSVLTMKPLSVWPAAIAFVQANLRPDPFKQTISYGSPFTPDDVEAVAQHLGADLVAEWKLTTDFLELHTADQLRDLAKLWKVDLAGCGKRGAIVDRLIEQAKPAGPPASLVKARRS